MASFKFKWSTEADKRTKVLEMLGYFYVFTHKKGIAFA